MSAPFKTAAPYHRLGMTQSYQPTPAEQRELQDIQQYLDGHAKAGTLDRIPEGGVNAVLNRASPNVRAHMLGSQAVVERFRDTNGREALFQPKKYIEDLPIAKETRQILDRADTEDVTYRLNERMNTPAASSQQNEGPPDRRETLAAAFDILSPQE